jgi:hypothetical protein
MILTVSDYLSLEDSYLISSSTKSKIKTPKFKNLEECENWFIENNIDLEISDKNITLVLMGGDSLCGSALYLCENLTKKSNKINIVYFIQEQSRLSLNEKTNNKIAGNVLQEYARSGLIESICLIDLSVINRIYENIPILRYKQYENLVVSDIVNFIDWTSTNPEPIYGKNIENSAINRIKTVSYVFLQNAQKIDFFNLEMSSLAEKNFYFLMSDTELDSNASALSIIKTIVGDDNNSSFAVYNIGSSVRANHFCINSTNLVKQIN